MSTVARKAGDFFRGERAKIVLTLGIIKAFGGVLLLILGVMISNALVPGVITFKGPVVVFEVLFLFGIALLIALFSLIGLIVGIVFDFLASVLGNVTLSAGFSVGMTYAMRSFFEVVLFNGVNFTNAGINTQDFLGSGQDAFGPLAYMLLYDTRISYEKDFISGIISIAFLLMFITGVNFIIQGKMSQAGISFGLSQFIFAFAYINELVRPMEIDGSSVGALLGSSLFQLALLSYIYLEYTLQISYLNNIAQPALERQKRVGKQLEMLEKFKLGLTEVGTTEEKERKKLMKKDEEDDEGVSTQLSAGGSGSTTQKKFGAEAMAFLLDSSKDSLFKGEKGEREKMTGRLQRYYDGLLRHDRHLNRKLGGSAGKSFNPITILIPVIISMGIRLLVLIYLSLIVLNADVFFSSITFPESLTRSIEFSQPESIILVLLPLIFLILGLSLLISKIQSFFIKSQELIIRESEIAKLLKKGKEIRSRKEGEKILAGAKPTTEKKEEPKKKPKKKRGSRPPRKTL